MNASNQNVDILTKKNYSRKNHWEGIWRNNRHSGKYYHRWLSRTYRFIIPKGSRVLELGCGSGGLLASLEPGYGMGIDFSASAIKNARKNYPQFIFKEGDIEDFDLNIGKFDFVILSDLINDLYDIQTLLLNIQKCCHNNTLIIINFYSQLWRWPLAVAQKFNLANRLLLQNWFTVADLENLFVLTEYEKLKDWSELIVPISLPGSNILNRYLPKIAPFRWFDMTNFVIAKTTLKKKIQNPTCSVIIAARNEEGHIEELIDRLPTEGMGNDLEIIFVEGNSTDETFSSIEKAIKNCPEKNLSLLKQSGKGKGDAVRKGFSVATGDILMILDADMTVYPEDLPRFYQAITSGKGEFINGVRLVYPMEDKSMRFFNLVGNKFFAFAFSWILGQPIRDTLCGTKVLWRKDYERIVANRNYFGDFDPFGDFDLIFGAAKLNLKILEVPIRYGARSYGETNISRWRHGWLLLRMVFFASRRIKFF